MLQIRSIWKRSSFCRGALTSWGVCRFCEVCRCRCAGPGAARGRWSVTDVRWGRVPSGPALMTPASGSAPGERWEGATWSNVINVHLRATVQEWGTYIFFHYEGSMHDSRFFRIRKRSWKREIFEQKKNINRWSPFTKMHTWVQLTCADRSIKIHITI